MTTKIPVELSSTPGIVDGSNATAITIDSSENVGIGTTSPNDKLHIKIGTNLNWQFGYPNSSVTTLAALNDAESAYVEGRIDASTLILNSQSAGNVGIGTTSPTGNGNLNVQAHSSSTITSLKLSNSTSGSGANDGFDLISNANIAYVWNRENDSMIFGTNNTEKMRIESTGDVRFNIANAALTAAEVHTFNNAGRGNNLGLYTTGADQHFSIDMWNHTGGSCNQVQFRGGGNGAVTGTITSTGNNATQYNTSSDYRLKENVDYTWDATTRLKQLKPVRFNWIDDDTNTLEDGFLAHEVSSVVPNAVRGEKDDVYTEEEASDDMHINAGDIKRQQLDHSKLVPLLVKTIQELEARIKTLEDA